MSGDNIFSGLKVVDMASFIAGPGQDHAEDRRIRLGVAERGM